MQIGAVVDHKELLNAFARVQSRSKDPFCDTEGPEVTTVLETSETSLSDGSERR